MGSYNSTIASSIMYPGVVNIIVKSDRRPYVFALLVTVTSWRTPGINLIPSEEIYEVTVPIILPEESFVSIVRVPV